MAMPKNDMLACLVTDLVKDQAALRREVHDLRLKVDVFRVWFDRFRRMIEVVERLERQDFKRQQSKKEHV